MDIQFSDWLNDQMQQRDWSQSDFARATGLSRQVISYYLSGNSKSPDENALQKIAHALKISPITVFRKAGLLPEGPEDKIIFDDWAYLLSQLEPSEQEEVRQIVELKIERRKKQEGLKSLKPRKAR